MTHGMSTDAKPKAGLEDVVAGESAICYLDGDRGVLAYQGYDIHDLADAERGASFEEVCYLLWHGRLPTRAELGDLQTQLAAARALPEPILRAMQSLPRVDGMDALRTLTSMLGHYDPDAADESPQANYRKAVRLTGQLGSLVATWGRMAAGGGHDRPRSGARPRGELPLHADRPAAVGARRRAPSTSSLVLHADHELNASTFAARVAAATLTDIHSAIVGAIGTLKGPLHGGANADVMKMLLDIGQDAGAERAEAVRPRQARAQGEDLRLRPSRVSHRGSARDAPAPVVEGARRAGRRAAVVRRCRSASSARQGREEALPERRLLLGVDVLLARAFRSISTRRSSR